MTSQLQILKHVEALFLYYSENHEHSFFKFSGIIFLSSNLNTVRTNFCFKGNRNWFDIAGCCNIRWLSARKDLRGRQ